jgi:hypothetical protein
MRGKNRKRIAPERHHLGSWTANQRRPLAHVVVSIPTQPSISLNGLAHPFALFLGEEPRLIQHVYDCAYHLFCIGRVRVLT